ncbi:MAG: class GN sortase [Nitrospirales bacterium]|nr:class GN sortase [Nitrospirales bacterium]
MTRRTVTALVVVLMVVGLWQSGHGAWIYVKARLAQHLLMHAWADTMDGQEHVKPWPWADTWPVARLRVPRHSVDLIVLAGASGRTLAFGPAIVNDGADQGFWGTLMISGHRDTHFLFLQHVSHGDELSIERPGQPHRTYRVTATQIIDSRTMNLISDPDGDQCC